MTQEEHYIIYSKRVNEPMTMYADCTAINLKTAETYESFEEAQMECLALNELDTLLKPFEVRLIQIKLL